MWNEGLENLGTKLKGTSIEHFKKRVDDLIVQSGKNIVVFVDDIDRLDIQEMKCLCRNVLRVYFYINIENRQILYKTERSPKSFNSAIKWF